MVHVAIEFRDVDNARSAWVAPEVHDCARLVDADRTDLMLTSPVGRARDSYGYGSCG